MRKGRLIIKKEDLVQKPIVYIRIKNNKVLYVGESKSVLQNRHIREEEDIGDFDEVICLKASSNDRRRRYWEAYLIVKLNPENQTVSRYKSFLYKANTGLAPSEVYKKSVRPKNLEELDKLTKKNNMRGVVYWGNQIMLAKKHLGESQACFRHFLECYEKDKDFATLKTHET